MIYMGFFTVLGGSGGGLALVLGLGAAPGALATPTILDFDDLSGGFNVTNQYQSVCVTVSGAAVISDLISPCSTNSSPNIAYAPTGLMTFVLDPSVTGLVQIVSAYISGDTSVGIYGAIHDGGSSFTIDNLTFTPAADISSIPEPGSAWLLGLGLLGLMEGGAA